MESLLSLAGHTKVPVDTAARDGTAGVDETADDEEEEEEEWEAAL